MGDPLPRWLEGVWRRDGRAFAEGQLEEVSEVMWAQVGRYFADVRVPIETTATFSYLDEAQAFSGELSYLKPIAVRRHDLDTSARPLGYHDTAELRPARTALLEVGAGYRQRWRKEACLEPAAVIERRSQSGILAARVLVVADLAVAVWGRRQPGGATLRFEEGGWDVEAYVGAGPIPWAAVHKARFGRVATGWRKVA